MKKSKLFLFMILLCGVLPHIRGLELQQPITVSGVIADASDVPIPGATIMIQGTTQGTASDMDGKFTITVPNEKSVLQISFVGYQTQTVVVGDRRNLRIVMAEAVSALDEVVVVGYGVQKKVSVTGAISSVQAGELKVSSSTNISNALAGRISGLTAIQRVGGQPGRDDVTMYLRGAATTNGVSPLILIDGVPRDNIRTIDPNEVESISILKDASATAVFGVRGANGVLMITTRRGKAGKPELTLNATQTFSALTREPERLHSLDYLKYRNQALSNDGMYGGMFDDEIIAKFENPLAGLDPNDPDYEQKAAVRRFMYPDNDFYRMMIKRWSPQTVVNANLTGGTDKIAYFMNVGYIHQGGNLKTEPESVLGYDPSVKLDRYSFRSNVDYKVTSSLTAFVNLGTYIEKVNMPATGVMYGNDQNWMMRDMFYNSLTVLPISPGPATIAGFGVEPGIPLDPTYLNSGSYMDRSPYEIINYRGYLTETRANLNSTVGANWDLGFITEGLSVKGMISYDSWAKTEVQGNKANILYQAMVDPKTDELVFSAKVTNGSPLSLSKSVQSRYTVNAQASILYNRKFGLHETGGMILAQRDYWEGTGAGIPYNVVGIAGRATYNYDLRYFGEFNIGYNGSEQFAPKNRFGLFPAVSVGWAISNESFLKNNPVLTWLKLRASFGRAGNDKMGDNRFLYQDNITVPGGGGYLSSLAQGAYVSEGLLGNLGLQWEQAEKYNLGVDFQIMQDLKGSVDVYKEDRSHILITRSSVPVFQGVPIVNVPKANMGEVTNRGFEVELSYTKPIRSDMLIEIKGNFGYNQNKRLYMDEVPRDETYAYRQRSTGYSLGQAWGYEIDWNQDGGYWTPEALADPNRVPYSFGTPRPGDFVYKNTNGDEVIDEKDQVPIGCGNIPRITWGASASLQYKGFDFYIFFQGLAQYYNERSEHGVYETIMRGTYFPYHWKAWTEERWENGEEITYPALSAVKGVNHRANSFFVMNRSFARLKNAEIGYTLPANLLKAIGISKMRIFASGQNIFTWSPKYRLTHLDPENDDTIGYPVTKTFSFGANITF